MADELGKCARAEQLGLGELLLLLAAESLPNRFSDTAKTATHS